MYLKSENRRKLSILLIELKCTFKLSKIGLATFIS